MVNFLLNERNVLSLKKQKMKVNDKLNKKLLNKSKSSHIVEEIKKQKGNKKKLVKQNITGNKNIDTNKESSVNINYLHSKNNSTESNMLENIKYSDHVNETIECEHTIIIKREMEDSYITPENSTELENLENPKDIKIENINSPQNCSLSDLNINLMEQLMEAPCKNERLYSCSEDTPNKKPIRTLTCGDFDELPDIVKTELYNDELNDMEAIDMLHDMSSVMDFEESKIPTDILCSTMNNAEQENITELSKSTKVEYPLSIDNNDNTSNENTSPEIKSKDTMPSSNIQEKECSTNNTNVENNTKRKRKHESNKKKTDVDYGYIKHILGELDIKLTSDEEEINESSEDIINDRINKLYDLNVKLMHEVPIQHKIEHTAGSKTLTRKEKKLFLSHGPMKSGTFTPNEDEIISNNWKAFCETHNWDPKCVTPFIRMKNDHKFYIKSLEERQKFVQFLANGLPWRTLYSVYHRFKYLYRNHEKRFQRFTSSEDEQILLYIQNKGEITKSDKRFVELSKILGRPEHSIWLRYQRLKMLKNKKPSIEVKWTLSLIHKFIKTFLSVTIGEKVEDLKHAIIPKSVWKKLEEKLDIDYTVLRNFWTNQLHMQLFCPEPIYLNDIKIKLIEYVYGKGISNTREIIWADVAKYFDGITSIFLCKTFFYLVQETSKKIGTNYFPDIVEYLYTEKIQSIKDDCSDKFLPRLSYSKKRIKIVDKDLNEDFCM